jgi:hypothetical protein
MAMWAPLLWIRGVPQERWTTTAGRDAVTQLNRWIIGETRVIDPGELTVRLPDNTSTPVVLCVRLIPFS